MGRFINVKARGDCDGSADPGRQPQPNALDVAPPGMSGTDRAETLADCLRKLVQLLPQVTRGIRRRQVPLGIAGAKLGPRHGAALSLLNQEGALTVGRLATELGLTLPTVSGIIADVEQAGFVQRMPDPTDRRRTIVSLVAQHNEALTAWLDGATAPMVRALNKLSPEERAAFLKGMTYLEAELNDADRSTSPAPDST
jgi:DNA-binding MarR family transcriptional regulator